MLYLKTHPTKRSQNGNQNLPNVQTTRRSLVENDRLPSFPGAPRQRTAGQKELDGWDCAGFLEIVLSYGTPFSGSPFLSLSLPSRQ